MVALRVGGLLRLENRLALSDPFVSSTLSPLSPFGNGGRGVLPAESVRAGRCRGLRRWATGAQHRSCGGAPSKSHFTAAAPGGQNDFHCHAGNLPGPINVIGDGGSTPRRCRDLYHGGSWMRHFVAAAGCFMLSGMVRLGEWFVRQGVGGVS